MYIYVYSVRGFMKFSENHYITVHGYKITFLDLAECLHAIAYFILLSLDHKIYNLIYLLMVTLGSIVHTGRSVW